MVGGVKMKNALSLYGLRKLKWDLVYDTAFICGTIIKSIKRIF